MLLRLLGVLALLAVGAGGGLAAALVHESWWGLLLGIAAAALTTLALPPGWRFAFMLGWFGAIGRAALPRVEGDYLVPATTAGYVLLGGSFVLFLTSLATVPRPVSRRRGDGDDPVVSAG